jgi:16S rRNA (guanine1207-N2)-methyltransferase
MTSRLPSRLVHYFDREPVAPSARREVPLTLPDLDVSLVTDRAVFSGDRVDPGTLYLLRRSPSPPPTCDLLDLGCGYGPVAVALAHRAPDATVWAVDVNERAVELCRHNARRLGLNNLRALAPDEVEPDIRFAGVWSNPPIRIGKAALHALLQHWLSRLVPGGHAYLVVHRHLGSDSLARWFAEQQWKVERLGSRAGYRVLDVAPTTPDDGA